MRQLYASSSTGTGDRQKIAANSGKALSQHAVQVVSASAATVLVVDLEGSLDGITWFQLMQHTFTSAELTAKQALFFNINPQPVLAIRSNLITNTGGGIITIGYAGQ